MSYWIRRSVLMFYVGILLGSIGCECDPACSSPLTSSRIDAIIAAAVIPVSAEPPVEPQADKLESLKEAIEDTSAVESEEAKNTLPSQTPADVVLPEPDPISTPPVVTFSRAVSASDSLIRSQSTVTEYWLVSEPWCANCPAAKKRFIANGRPEDHILTIKDAKRLHGKTISSIPAEYTTSEVRETINPPKYREQQIMQVTLNGSHKPLRESILAHLRGGGPHQGKHWQAWHLESWRTPQLYALHDDDHAGVVPTFETESNVIATVANADGTAETFAAVVSQHLIQSSGSPVSGDMPMSSLFDFTVEVDQSWKTLAQKLLTRQKIEFPSAGLSIDWSGPERSFKISSTGIAIQPPVKMTVNKWVFRYSVGLNAVAFKDDLSSVTLDLSGAPDVTINLVSRKVASETVWIWSGSGDRPIDMPPRKGDREFDGGPDFGNGSWAQREEDGTWLRYGG